MIPRQDVAIIAGQLVIGGAERQLFLWLSQLDRARYSPVVLTLHPGHSDYWENAIKELGIPLLFVPPRRNQLFRLIEITKKLRPFRPDLVHGWHLFASPYAGGAAKLLRAKASLGSLRGSFQSYERNRSKALLTRWLVGGLIVNSQAAARQLAKNRFSKGRRLYVVPNAVEEPLMGRSQARVRLSSTWRIPDSRFWIGSVGRFEPAKRFDFLLDIVAGLQAQGEDVHLVLIGDGRMAGELKAKAAQLHLENRVTFTGELPCASECITAFDVFGFPSMDEGLPNAVMEAAMAGVPVVAWQTEFITDLLEDKVSALLAPAGNVGAMRQLIVCLIRQPQLRERLAAAARQNLVANYGLRQMVEGMSAAYEYALHGRNEVLNSSPDFSLEIPAR